MKKVVGIGWCGTYRDGSLGWMLSPFLSKYGEPLSANQGRALGAVVDEKTNDFAPSDMYRVKITVEPIKNKNGKYIVRRTKRKGDG